ncbi:hypothetical protein F4815DRAFT_464475 [Daldinia loculata]|nr:hypothetical protein F4815DRAFT_464475 [Daldinia loculata]
MASLRKFPFSFGVGTDICQISRIYKIIAQKKGSNFIHRVLTKDEINSVRGASHVLEPIYSRRHLPESDLFPNGNIEEEIPAVATAARFMAGRWAAKEAVIKSCSAHRVSFHDIIITYEHQLDESSKEQDISPLDSQEIRSLRQTGPPVAVIKGHGTGDMYGRISISHDGDYAVATCVTFWDEPGPEASKTNGDIGPEASKINDEPGPEASKTNGDISEVD